MKASISLLAAALLCASLSFGFTSSVENKLTSVPFISEGEGPDFIIDHANFRGLEDKTYIEFYLQVPYDELQFIKNQENFRAEYDLELSITNERGKEVQYYKNHDIVDVDSYMETISETKARVSLMAFTFDPGTYKIKAVIKDFETRQTSKIERDFQTRSYLSRELLISDLQFSQKIVPADDGQSYVKNQRYIEPNPVRTFSNALSENFYVYFEIYNFDFEQTREQPTYTAFYIFHNSDGEKIAEIKRQKSKPGATAAQSIRFPLDQFTGGEYHLTIRIQDDSNYQTAEVSSGFTILEKFISVSENILK